MTTYRHIETQLAHAGEPLPRIAGAVEMPARQASWRALASRMTSSTPTGPRAGRRSCGPIRAPSAIVAPSLGGVHTLLTRPATTSHAGLSRDERLRLGISDGLLRLSVGIEATEDLMEDLQQALR